MTLPPKCHHGSRLCAFCHYQRLQELLRRMNGDESKEKP